MRSRVATAMPCEASSARARPCGGQARGPSSFGQGVVGPRLTTIACAGLLHEESNMKNAKNRIVISLAALSVAGWLATDHLSAFAGDKKPKTELSVQDLRKMKG